MFSKSCEYGIRATLYVAKQSLNDTRCSLKEIAKAIDSPEAFTAKILQDLSKNKILQSSKGPTGGFEISPIDQERIRLSHIVFAIDGDDVYKGCGLGLKSCNSKKPCPLHDKFMSVRADLKNLLEQTTIKELALGLTDGYTFLKR